MTTDSIEPASTLRLFEFCLIAALGALLAVAYWQLDGGLLLPIAIAVLALLSFADGYWRTRS